MKTRSVASIKNFRGIDSENKAIKVEQYRCVEGENFIIDSDTLKTRPGLQYKKSINYGYDILDIYDFRGNVIVVTPTTIMLSENIGKTFTYTEEENRNKPIFQEEKDCLFIFGIGGVFVVSYSNDEFIVYELNKKPENYYEVGTEKYNFFENLPKPYEPIIFIGEDRFDDVNLLSNVTMYQLFGDIDNSASMLQYTLPTTYEPSINGKYEVGVEFFENNYSNIEVFPEYVGKLVDGDIINNEEPILLDNHYVEEQAWEVIDDVVVNEKVNITKKEIFGYKVKESSLTLYNYLLVYLSNLDTTDWVANKYMKVELNIQVVVNRRNAQNMLEKSEIEKSKIYVYVKLNKYDERAVALEKKETKSRDDYTVVTPSNPFSVEPMVVINEPKQVENTHEDQAYDLVNEYLTTNIEKFTEGEYALYPELVMTSRVYKPEQYLEFNENYISQVRVAYAARQEGSSVSSIANNYPSVSEATEMTYTTTQRVEFSYINSDRLPSNINEIISKVVQKRTHRAKIHLKLYTDNPLGGFEGVNAGYVAKAITIVVDVREPQEKTRNHYFTYYFLCDVKRTVLMKDSIYKVTYNEGQKAFTLSMYNLIYDFDLQPSIKVRVTFEKNPDYEKIANMKIGTTFGSENRLFLAGDDNYPNIDRYNVSNDLLGNNVINQSYELSYFPSKNFRVLGGKGKINGYVTATDTSLYVTKENYPNDKTFYIRTRSMDENGIVGYNEYKTNINLTPINHKCIVSFYNEILVLDEKGLYAIEISSNVLTNERLQKLRSSFINKELVQAIKNNANNVFIYENNYYMYIVIGKTIYVADIRYISQNPNSQIENYGFEFSKWILPFEIEDIKQIDNETIFFGKDNTMYGLVDNGYDEEVFMKDNFIKFIGNDRFETNGNSSLIDKVKLSTIAFYILAKNNQDYTVEDNVVTIRNFLKFRQITNGERLYFRNSAGEIVESVVVNLDEYERNTITLESPLEENVDILISVSNKELKAYNITTVFNLEETKTYFRLTPYDTFFDEDIEFVMSNEVYYSCLIINRNTIQTKWITPLLSFGNTLYEKTMFKMILTASILEEYGKIRVGRRTMRNAIITEDSNKTLTLGKNNNLEDTLYNMYNISTFEETGTSIPMKENNFLYIQFFFYGYGKIEMNGIEILYKNNRAIKTSA